MPGSKPIVFVKAFLMHCIVTVFILIVKGRKKYFPRDSYPSHRFLTFLPTLAPSDGSAATLATAKQGQLFCVSHFSILFYSYYFHSYVSAPTYPFRQPDGCHLSQGKASHTLLQRRFAPRKVVRLLPDKRGRLFCVSHSHIFVFIHIKNMNSFFLSVRFPRMRREVPSHARR